MRAGNADAIASRQLRLKASLSLSPHYSRRDRIASRTRERAGENHDENVK